MLSESLFGQLPAITVANEVTKEFSVKTLTDANSRASKFT